MAWLNKLLVFFICSSCVFSQDDLESLLDPITETTNVINTFKSTRIIVNENKALVEGILSFAGETREIVNNVEINIENDISFSGTLMIKLSDYKIIRPSLLFKKIDDEIKIEFSIRIIDN